VPSALGASGGTSLLATADASPVSPPPPKKPLKLAPKSFRSGSVPSLLESSLVTLSLKNVRKLRGVCESLFPSSSSRSSLTGDSGLPSASDGFAVSPVPGRLPEPAVDSERQLRTESAVDGRCSLTSSRLLETVTVTSSPAAVSSVLPSSRAKVASSPARGVATPRGVAVGVGIRGKEVSVNSGSCLDGRLFVSETRSPKLLPVSFPRGERPRFCGVGGAIMPGCREGGRANGRAIGLGCIQAES